MTDAEINKIRRRRKKHFCEKLGKREKESRPVEEEEERFTFCFLLIIVLE
jgi:hypothetical protein